MLQVDQPATAPADVPFGGVKNVWGYTEGKSGNA
ncbi:hypothetical protein SAMN05446635_0351 [Burkholderia sp. OK233]|nr:hypothetical protein SAMN05446635_0351 [Burkholderia sp. OK233]